MAYSVELSAEVARQLGTTVLIRAKTPERGQIIIDYHSREEFDRFMNERRNRPAS